MTDTRIAAWHDLPGSGLAANNASMWEQSQCGLPRNRGRLKIKAKADPVRLATARAARTWPAFGDMLSRSVSREPAAAQQVDCPRHRHRARDLYVLGRIPGLNIAVLRSLQPRSSFTVVIEEMARIFPRAVRYRQ